jgi:hypothetical protein
MGAGALSLMTVFFMGWLLVNGKGARSEKEGHGLLR